MEWLNLEGIGDKKNLDGFYKGMYGKMTMCENLD
jgi:hypothetical protein